MLPLFQLGMEVFPYIEEMQTTGMPASKAYFTSLYDELTQSMIDIGDGISTNYFNGNPFNPNSSPQTAQLALSQGLVLSKKTSGGAPSTSKGAIEKYRYTNDAIAQVFNWRETAHVRDKFCRLILDAMVGNGIPGTNGDIYNVQGRIKWTKIPSRRLAMEKTRSGINLLNMSKRQGSAMPAGLAGKVRAGFICPPGERMSAFDLSQMEMRVIAWLSGDDLMCKLFRDGRDIHAETASRMYNVPIPDLIEKLHRLSAKTVGFLVGFGGGASTLLDLYLKLGLKGTPRSAQKDINNWYKTFPGVEPWKQRVAAQVKRDGYAATISGMRRYLPAINSDNPGAVSAALREAVSQIVQGIAQDMVQNSMIWIWDKLVELRSQGWKVRPALQLHDELIFRHEPDVFELLEELVIEGLTEHHGVDITVPVLASGGMGRNWGEI